MKISINWVKEYIDINNHSTEEISDILTKIGLEVEGVEKFEQVKGGLEGLVIGNVITCEKHPNADKLKKTTVDIGNNTIVPIVCGAPNVEAGQQVIVAPVGSVIYPINHDPVKIKKAKIRGEVSEGMIVAEDEIGLGHSHEGIMVLDTELPAGAPAAKLFNLESDHILEIGLTPNRADAASHIGVARDLKAALNREVKWPPVDHFRVDDESNPIPVIVENHEACPRYSAVTIGGVKVEASPEWLKTRLRAIGMTPINNIVDITNYVLHETGQPLHAFDADKISGKKVIVKTLPEGSVFTTLDGKERKLGGRDLMICNEEEGMCIAGVFGGVKSGVTETTTSVFLESAYFNPGYIRRTAQRHGLKTDASFRFERGTDPELTLYALKRAAILIQELAGGKITSQPVDVYPEKISGFVAPVIFKNIDRLIGKKLGKEKIFNILSNLDIEVKEVSESGFAAVIPPYRVDVTREADVIEEILRVYGYDNVELSTHLGSDYLSDFPENDPHAIQFRIADLLAANGFNEIITNSLTKPWYAEKIKGFNPEKNVEILNKLSEELGALRQSPLFTGLETVAYNINHKHKDLKLFEFGKSYSKKGAGYKEDFALSIYMTGHIEAENWRRKTEVVQFHDIYSIIQKIFNKFIPGRLTNQPAGKDYLAYGLQINDGSVALCTAGAIDPETLRIYDIRQEVFYAEIEWEALLKTANRNFRYREISKYPEVRRDLSLVIDKKVTFEKIKELALKQENQLIREINIFDYYEGDKIENNKKAYALSFILQDPSKTLTDKVIDKTMERLMKSYETELGATIRK